LVARAHGRSEVNGSTTPCLASGGDSRWGLVADADHLFDRIAMSAGRSRSPAAAVFIFPPRTYGVKLGFNF